MSENVYAQCDSKCKHPVYTKDDYIELEGSINLTANTSSNLSNNLAIPTNIPINYPDGCNMNNVYCEAILLKNPNGEWSNNSQDGISLTVRTMQGSLPRTLTLRANDMLLSVGNIQTSAIEVQYKIILFKYK